MRVRLRWLGPGALVVLLACNAITGAHDRVIDDTTEILDSGKASKDHNVNEPGEIEAGQNQNIDASVLDVVVDANRIRTIHVDGNSSWTTPNKATFTRDANGVVITDFDPSAGHPVVTPEGVTVPTSNYTVLATVLPRVIGEFGIMIRVTSAGGGIILGSKISNGDTPQPFLAPMAPPDWNPIGPFAQGQDTQYTFQVNQKYKMKLVAQDTVISGKMWLEGTTEPSAQALFSDNTQEADRGHGVGWYSYLKPDVTLVDMTISYVEP